MGGEGFEEIVVD